MNRKIRCNSCTGTEKDLTTRTIQTFNMCVKLFGLKSTIAHFGTAIITWRLFRRRYFKVYVTVLFGSSTLICYAVDVKIIGKEHPKGYGRPGIRNGYFMLRKRTHNALEIPPPRPPAGNTKDYTVSGVYDVEVCPASV